MASVFKRGGKTNRHGYYYIAWVDHTGKRRSKCTRTTDKATAERLAAKNEDDAAKRREGLLDPQVELYATEARRPLTELVEEYENKLVANGRETRYIADAVRYIKRIAAGERIGTLGELTAERVSHFAAGLAKQGKSARTIQAAIGATKSFTRWLVDTGKLPRDPLATVKKPNPESDRRRERRMLLPDEWPFLVQATERGPERCGMSGVERALLYRLAVTTGLRANELRSLTAASVMLDAEKPSIRVKAAHSKNGKAAQQFIDLELRDLLRTHISKEPPASILFTMPDRTKLAGMIRSDLKAARDAWVTESQDNPAELTRRLQSDFLNEQNHAGERFDFHSLRHTCGSWMALAGVQPKMIQAVMRHSAITLTMGTYGHLLPGTEASAAVKLGGMTGRTVNGGTEQLPTSSPDSSTEVDAQRLVQQMGRKKKPPRAPGYDRKKGAGPIRTASEDVQSPVNRGPKQGRATAGHATQQQMWCPSDLHTVDFESGCWPIRLPSELIEKFSRGGGGEQ